MHYSPLRYPGGKGKLAHFIGKTLEYNNLYDTIYIEPYAGGSSVGLYLLFEGHVKRILINDLDYAIYAFWWAVLNDTETFCRLLIDTPVTLRSWYIQKDIYNSQEQHDLTQLGFAAFFLNRTNRSGVLKGGVIGGKQQDGLYKINARFNKENLLERIKLIASLKRKIEIRNEDAVQLLNSLDKDSPKKYVLYLDPPYFKKGKLLYKNSYSIDDHFKVAKVIKTFTSPWLVTYDNTIEIQKFYQGINNVNFDISYSAHITRPRGKEIMFYNNISLPCLPYTRMTDMPNHLISIM